MRRFKYIIPLIFIFTLINAPLVLSEEYFCADGGYVGEFDINSKRPNANKCEHLKNYPVSYNSCKYWLQSDIDLYNKGYSAYQKGKCYKYKTATHSYGSASCSANYVITQNGYSIKGNGGSENNEDINMCHKQLENKLMQQYNNLKNSQK